MVSNRENGPTAVDLIFYNENEQPISSGTEFWCWQYPTDVLSYDSELDSDFGLAGLVTASATQGGNPATLLGFVETEEDIFSPGESKVHKYTYRLINNGALVTTTFVPKGGAGTPFTPFAPKASATPQLPSLP